MARLTNNQQDLENRPRCGRARSARVTEYDNWVHDATLFHGTCIFSMRAD
jgi:hypothetical protein